MIKKKLDKFTFLCFLLCTYFEYANAGFHSNFLPYCAAGGTINNCDFSVQNITSGTSANLDGNNLSGATETVLTVQQGRTYGGTLENRDTRLPFRVINNGGTINDLYFRANTSGSLTNNSGTTSFRNAGTFTSVTNQAGSTLNLSANVGTITTLTNQGTMNVFNNSRGGIITTLTNQGIISAANTSTIINEGTITNFINEAAATLGNFNSRVGTITNFINRGTMANTTQVSGLSTVTTFRNENNANINSFLTNARINLFENEGTITTLGLYNNNLSTGASTVTTLNNRNQITTFENRGRLITLNNQANGQITTFTNTNTATITDFNNQGQINTSLTNNGTITTLANSGTINNLTNTATISTFNNQTGATLNGALTNNGTITTFNQNSATNFTYAGTGNIGTFNATGTNTITYNNTGSITTRLDNQATINGALNLNGTALTAENRANASITTLTNLGNTSTLNNAGTITTLNNNQNAAIANLTNTNSLTTLNNNGVINILNNNGGGALTNLNNTGTITSLTNEATLTTLTNNTGGHITTLNNIQGLSTLINNATIGSFTTQNSMIYQGAGQITTNLNIQGASSTLTATANGVNLNGNLNNGGTLDASGQSLTLVGTGAGATYVNTGVITANQISFNRANSTFANNGTLNTALNFNADSRNTIFTNNSGRTITGNIAINQANGISFTNNGNINTSAGANTNTFTNSGSDFTLINSATIASDALTNSGANFSLTNTGTISSILTNSGVNANINNSGTLNSIANNAGGSITNLINAQNARINLLTNNAAITDLENDGTITTLINNAGARIDNLSNTSHRTITTLNNAGDIDTITNTGTINSLTNTGTLTHLTNSGNIINFTNNGVNTNLALNNSGFINTLTNQAGTINLSNSGTIASLTNEGTAVLNLNITQGTGIINSFTNTSTGGVNIINTGGRLGGIRQNGSGNINYTASDHGVLSLINPTNANQAAHIIFGNGTGVAGNYGNINIGANSITLNIRENNTDYNDFLGTALNKANNGHLVVSGGQLSDVAKLGFSEGDGQQAIIIDPSGGNFSWGRDYDLDAIVLYQQNTTTGDLIGVGRCGTSANCVNNNSGLSIENLIGSDSIYTIERGSRPNETFKIGIDAAQGTGAVTQQSFINFNTRRALFIDSVIANATLYNSNSTNTKNAFYLPYFSYEYIDLEEGGKVGGHTKGMIAGFHGLNKDQGLWGGYIGYEESILTSSGVRNTSLYDTQFKQYTTLAGIKHTYMLADYGDSLYFFKTHIKGSKSGLKLENNSGLGHTSVYGYGINFNLATSFHNDDYNSFYHTLGVGYEGSYMKRFKMSESPNVTYKSAPHNLIFANLGVKWKRLIQDKLRTSLEGGFKYHFLRKLKTGVIVKTGSSKQEDNGSFKIPSMYGFVAANVSIEVSKNFQLAVQGQTIAADNGQTYTGFIEMNYWWK
ncbi:hypothetical protein CQA38_06455 [Campylobacter sp. MIT 12-5580]|nr:hypothetical protein CQA38_06455 [Campylobacter sp. MIT 12-5580]